ncbi:MAG: (d)CMP kinase [Candidatus Omnitrophota bacterium]
MIICIDGPAGAGKSTIARQLAKKLGFLYIDTGAMYRAFTLKVLRSKVDFKMIEKLVELAMRTQITLKQTEDGGEKVFLDGEDVSQEIRTPELTNAVFKVAGIPQIREVMVHWQREYGHNSDIVMEGRDIGTVVFPKADKKFYLDADVQVRAQRRSKELQEKGMPVNFPELVQQIKDRDQRDKTRTSGPLKQAEDAVLIDSTGLSIREVVDKIFGYIKNE